MARADRRRVARAKPSTAPTRYESAYVGTEGLFFAAAPRAGEVDVRLPRRRVRRGFVSSASAATSAAPASPTSSASAAARPGSPPSTTRASGSRRSPRTRRRCATSPRRSRPTASRRGDRPAHAVHRAPAEGRRRLRGACGPAPEQRERRPSGSRDRAGAGDAARSVSAFLPASTSPLGQALATAPITSRGVDGRERLRQRRLSRLIAAYGDAARTYRKIVALDPDDVSSQLQLADAAQNSGDSATAIAAYKRFIALAPDDRARRCEAADRAAAPSATAASPSPAG